MVFCIPEVSPLFRSKPLSASLSETLVSGLEMTNLSSKAIAAIDSGNRKITSRVDFRLLLQGSCTLFAARHTSPLPNPKVCKYG